MNPKGNSPWDFPLELPSPDGKLVLQYLNVGEFGMGGPLAGRIALHASGSDQPIYDPSQQGQVFGGPAIWSEDNRFLALPLWERSAYDHLVAARPCQRIAVFDVREQLESLSPERLRIMHLTSFANGMIRGVESPTFEPRPFSMDVHALEWRNWASE